MQPQDNPLHNIQGDDVPAGDPNLPAGGSTFHPQENSMGGADMSATDGTMGPSTPPPTPDWHNEASADAAGVYGSPADNSAMPPNPLMTDAQSSSPAVQPATDAMNQDFNQASQMANPMPPIGPEPAQVGNDASQMPAGPAPIAPNAEANQMPPNPLLTENQPMPPSTQGPTMPSAEPAPAPVQPEMPATAMPEPATAPVATPAVEALPSNDMGGTPPPDVPGAVPEMNQPQMIQNEVPMPQPEPAGTPAPILAPQPGNLPGSQQLGAAAEGMDQVPGQNPAQAPMGSYGPPPKKSKKALFIILGAVIGIIIISVVVAVLLSSRKQTTQNVNTTTQTTPQTVATPTSGPATPPEGYVTIDKQCYTFALISPNTVPTDQACSFKKATFGQKAVSTINVDTSTTSYKTIDEFLDVFKQDKTVIKQDSIKLDNLDAQQIIYKYSDGKTYSYVAGLLVGKNYQQDGKAVTAVGINTSYQEAFDQTVTQNVIDTWRWK